MLFEEGKVWRETGSILVGACEVMRNSKYLIVSVGADIRVFSSICRMKLVKNENWICKGINRRSVCRFADCSAGGGPV